MQGSLKAQVLMRCTHVAIERLGHFANAANARCSTYFFSLPLLSKHVFELPQTHRLSNLSPPRSYHTIYCENKEWPAATGQQSEWPR